VLKVTDIAAPIQPCAFYLFMLQHRLEINSVFDILWWKNSWFLEVKVKREVHEKLTVKYFHLSWVCVDNVSGVFTDGGRTDDASGCVALGVRCEWSIAECCDNVEGVSVLSGAHAELPHHWHTVAAAHTDSWSAALSYVLFGLTGPINWDSGPLFRRSDILKVYYSH